LFSKLKNWRRVATRYDKTAESHIGFVGLVSAFLWRPFVHVAWFHRGGLVSTASGRLIVHSLDGLKEKLALPQWNELGHR
jgi:hypothetical protein